MPAPSVDLAGGEVQRGFRPSHPFMGRVASDSEPCGVTLGRAHPKVATNFQLCRFLLLGNGRMAEELSDRAKRRDNLQKARDRELKRVASIRYVLAGSAATVAVASVIFAISGLSDLRILTALKEAQSTDAPGLLLVPVIALFMGTVFALFAASRSTDDDQRSALSRFSRATADALLRATTISDLGSATRAVGRAVEDVRVRVLEEASQRQTQDFMRRPTDYIDILTQFRLRMRGEERRLKINSVINLVWGILFSLLTGGWLLFSVNELKVHSTYIGLSDMLAAYAPRAALAIILQLVSFFFLRLYAATEHEIKHHKNEITNMESRFAGAMFEASASTSATRAIVLKSFMTVERNFLIKKGERTAATEADTRYNDLAALFETFVSVQAKQKSRRKPTTPKVEI